MEMVMGMVVTVTVTVAVRRGDEDDKEGGVLCPRLRRELAV